AAVISIVTDRNTVIQTQRPDRQIQAQTDTPVVVVIFEIIRVRIVHHITDVVEKREAQTIDDRQTVFRDRKSTRLNSSHVKTSYAVILTLSLHDALPICRCYIDRD